MLKKIQRYFERRAEQKQTEAYNRGFNFAAGALLRGEETAATLEGLTYGYSDPFDNGARAAMRQLISLNVVADTRI